MCLHRPSAGPCAGAEEAIYRARGGAQIGRLLLYREVNGRCDSSDIGVCDDYQGRGVATQVLGFAFQEAGADRFTLSTGTTGDGTQLVLAYGEGGRERRRVEERPPRSVPATRSDFAICPEGPESNMAQQIRTRRVRCGSFRGVSRTRLGERGRIWYLLHGRSRAIQHAADLMNRKDMEALLASAPLRKKVAPAQMDLRSEAGRRLVMSAAKRVVGAHHLVLEALANR